MSHIWALDMMARLMALTLILQAIEIFQLSRQPSFQKIWNFAILRADLESGLPLPKVLVRLIFSNRSLTILSLLEVCVASLGFFLLSPWVWVTLFVFRLIICIRFRGTFNGGSDMMVLVVLTGLIIISFAPTIRLLNLGFIYVTVHVLYSYVRAGLAKISQREWRNGTAIAEFLNRSLFEDVQNLSVKMSPHLYFVRGLAFLAIIFELTVPLALLGSQYTVVFATLAILFHFINFFLFGLNRFFWAWIAAWPAILYTTTLLHPR
jgi:hypothetical protein